MIDFEPAIREQMHGRIALIGPTGSGKTHGALVIATALAPVEDIAIVDSENERAKLEADIFGPFRHGNLREKTPATYTAAMNKAFAEGAKVVILDSVSPEWSHCLGLADRFGAWKEVRPPHNDWIESMKYAPGHLIVTMRAKMKYLVTEIEDGSRKRQQIEPAGMGPIQDENLPYEFDVVAYLNREHQATFSNRCRPLEGKTMNLHEAAPIIASWLKEGAKPEPIATADEADVETLRGLLVDEGVSDERIEAGFAAARRENRGQLHPDYVAEQTRKAQERLERRREAEARAAEAGQQEGVGGATA